jgi:phosphopantothenoylcysteine decarboxylase/phosphopantothenate--cysteine ligase
VAPVKVKKADAPRSISLEPTTDIAASMGKHSQGMLVVFAAETHDLAAHARAKLVGKGADLVVANRVGAEGTGFDTETNDAILVTRDGEEELPRLAKDELARRLWDRIVEIRTKTG